MSLDDFFPKRFPKSADRLESSSLSEDLMAERSFFILAISFDSVVSES